MNKLSKQSALLLSQCHLDLQRLVKEVLKVMDISVIVAYRNQEDQNKAFDEGKSKLRFPNSKHNKMPSLAVDVCPFPIDWTDHRRFYFMMGVFKAKAHELGIKIRLGGDFNNDNNLKNDSFIDLPHIELA